MSGTRRALVVGSIDAMITALSIGVSGWEGEQIRDSSLLVLLGATAFVGRSAGEKMFYLENGWRKPLSDSPIAWVGGDTNNNNRANSAW